MSGVAAIAIGFLICALAIWAAFAITYYWHDAGRAIRRWWLG